MSRSSDRSPNLAPHRSPPPEQQVERMNYSAIPNNKGIERGVERTFELFKVEVTPSYLRRAVDQRRLARHEIGHTIHFSDRDLYDFIVLGTRKTTGRREMRDQNREMRDQNRGNGDAA